MRFAALYVTIEYELRQLFGGERQFRVFVEGDGFP